MKIEVFFPTRNHTPCEAMQWANDRGLKFHIIAPPVLRPDRKSCVAFRSVNQDGVACVGMELP